MHTYTKNYIDNLMKNAILGDCEVAMIKLTAEDITNFKLSLIKNEYYIPKEEGIDNTSMVDKLDEKQQKLDKNGMDILKLGKSIEGETQNVKSQLNSPLKTIKEMASTSTEKVSTIIDGDKSTKSANFSAQNVKPKIRVVDPKKIMNEDRYKKWMKTLLLDKPKHITNGKTNLAVAKPSTIKPNPSLYSTEVNGLKYHISDINYIKENLTKIENVYKKYFGKSVQVTIVIIANILNMISISNRYHKERMDECFKETSDAKKIKERCIASHFHGIHKKILETKLKINFVYVISSFAESEFYTAIKMFFLCILTVFRVLGNPKTRKVIFFNNLVLLLSTSLKHSEYHHPKMFSIFQSKKFRPDCIELISFIEDSRDIDPGVIYRMRLFFISKVDIRGHFQAATDVVSGKSNENLELLIDNAVFQCFNDSKFKDSVDSSTAEHSNQKLPLTETIQSPINSDRIIQHTFLVKNPIGTYQQILVPNSNKFQVIGNAGVEPLIVTSQPVNNSNEQFSSSLQKKTYESSTSTVVPTKKITVVTPVILNSPLNLHQTTSSSETATSTTTNETYVTLNPSIQNIRTEPNSTSHRTQSNTIVVGNRPYEKVILPSGKIRAVTTTTNLPQKPLTIECYGINCKKSATIMCSKCKNVKYCSLNCQRRHWYTKHVYDCDNLLELSQTTVNCPLSI